MGLAIVATGCSVAVSPPVHNSYIPMRPDETPSKLFNAEFYHWPLQMNGIQTGDSGLIFIDSKSSYVGGLFYIPISITRYLKIGIEPFARAAVWRVGAASSTGRIYTYTPYLGMGVTILPHFTSEHFIIGAELTPLAFGYSPPIFVSYSTDSGIDVNTYKSWGNAGFSLEYKMMGAFAYFTSRLGDKKFYIGPYMHLPIDEDFQAGGINSGIIFTENGSEKMRLGFSIAYGNSTVYKDLNLFPFALNISFWKRLR